MAGVFGASHLCIAGGGQAEAEFPPPPSSYAVKFREQGIPNPPAKRPFLRQWSDVHGLAFRTAPASISLEMLEAGQSPAASRTYLPVLPVGPAEFEALKPDESLGALAALYGRELRPGRWGGVSALATPAGPDSKEGLRTIALGCADVRSSAAFWTHGLGLRAAASAAQADGGVRLELRALAASWNLTLLLYHEPGAEGPMHLDDLGCNCLSLFTRGLADWTDQRLAHGGRDHGEPFVIRAGGRELQAVFLRGPNGELVELLDYR